MQGGPVLVPVSLDAMRLVPLKPCNLQVPCLNLLPLCFPVPTSRACLEPVGVKEAESTSGEVPDCFSLACCIFPIPLKLSACLSFPDYAGVIWRGLAEQNQHMAIFLSECVRVNVPYFAVGYAEPHLLL